MKTLIFFTLVISVKITIIQPFEIDNELDVKCNATEFKIASSDYEDCKQESTRLYTEMNKQIDQEKPISEILNKTKE